MPAPDSPDICGQARKSLCIETFKLLALVLEPSGQARKSLWIETTLIVFIYI